MKDTAAIIVAGGKGLRYGGRIRKQYLRLKQKPILWWSVRAFEKSASVRSIVVVVPQDDVEDILKQVRSWAFEKIQCVVHGGASRAGSVREGLKQVGETIRYVAVHDAVRPLVEPDLVEAVIAAARRNRAALAACPSKDTVKLANGGGYVASSPPRESVWLAHTPQVFERALLARAHKAGRKLAVTDDAQLVERMGVKVKLVPSSPENIKVTVPMDFVLAGKILEARS